MEATTDWTIVNGGEDKVTDSFTSWFSSFTKEKPRELAECSGVKVVLMTEWTTEMTEAIAKCIPHATSSAGLNDPMACNGCRRAANDILMMRGADMEPLFMSGEITSYPEDFHPLWHAARSGKFDRVCVASPAQLGLYTTEGWNHFAVKCAGMPAKRTKVAPPEYGINAKILQKYMGLLRQVFEKNAVPGIHASLDALIATLPKVLYGGKLLESAIWFRKHVREDYASLSRLEKTMNRASALFDLKHCTEVGSKNVTLPLYHQLTKNTLDALESCDNVEALTALLKERLSPLNYQVKTAEATNGQVEMALKHIGDFSVKLMTLESALAHGAIKIEHDPISSAFSAFSKMKLKNKGVEPRSKSAAGFSERAGANLSKLLTMKDLMENMPRNLQINTEHMTAVVANDFVNLKEGVYKTPFTWGFAINRPISEFGLKGWHNVLAVLPLLDSFLFICEHASLKRHWDVCCHVALLTPEYNKSCGQAFGNLHKTMEVDTSPPGPHAIGVGVCFNRQKLNDPDPPLGGKMGLTLRSGVSEFTIR